MATRAPAHMREPWWAPLDVGLTLCCVAVSGQTRDIQPFFMIFNSFYSYINIYKFEMKSDTMILILFYSYINVYI